ncbi:MAG: UvrB/UvrC motif-containing protein [Planctomycetia bacterium]|nr:UvrB/UvrC motif-containing protein [Planctomycetia bacterium]
MKCQKCNREATFHITELLGGKPQELHLCSEHAQEYLEQTQDIAPATSNVATALAHHMAQQMSLSKTSKELDRMDEEVCPICGMTFFEFRNLSRLGCANDYQFFWKQLEPLLLSIHGEITHVGKRPARAERLSPRFTELIKLRREMQNAVKEELYEIASVIRDKIRKIETEGE